MGDPGAGEAVLASDFGLVLHLAGVQEGMPFEGFLKGFLHGRRGGLLVRALFLLPRGGLSSPAVALFFSLLLKQLYN
ncbi:MAG: hypothetical protein A2V67_18030 [Deltaproteobacteria bacterium RBG_13_61_14]|nr:MAG: hypothetical protein A2V67_18030 [Deltaproteobacteria bacterium RBG_13_61_14]